jgi:hypothetical protein
LERSVVDRVRTWNELHDFFSQNFSSLGDGPARAAIAEYLEFLKVSNTVLPVHAKSTRKPPRFAGVPDASICREVFLQLTSSLSPGIDASIESDRNVPPQLRLGRETWRQKFGCVWVQRIWLNLRIEPNTGHYFVWAHLIFHHAQFTRFEYAARLLPQWASICSRAGLLIGGGPGARLGWTKRRRITRALAVGLSA